MGVECRGGDWKKMGGKKQRKGNPTRKKTLTKYEIRRGEYRTSVSRPIMDAGCWCWYCMIIERHNELTGNRSSGYKGEKNKWGRVEIVLDTDGSTRKCCETQTRKREVVSSSAVRWRKKKG